MKPTIKEKFKIWMQLFFTFFKIGAISFGGGYAMLTLIEREFVDKKKWLTREELLDIFAIGESTPGAIAINIATFLGTKLGGIFGGIVATFGVVLPAFLIVLALSYVIDVVKTNIWVVRAFKGVRVGVLVLIAQAVIKFLKTVKKDWISVPILVVTFCLSFFSNINVIYILLGIFVFMLLYASISGKQKRNLMVQVENAQQERQICIENLIEGANVVKIQEDLKTDNVKHKLLKSNSKNKDKNESTSLCQKFHRDEKSENKNDGGNEK